MNTCIKCGEIILPGKGCECAVKFERIATFDKIARELDRAYGKHGRDQWGRHEFYAIMLEEVDELWDAIKADKPQADVQSEAIQIAAMVFRYLETGDRYREPNKQGNL